MAAFGSYPTHALNWRTPTAGHSYPCIAWWPAITQVPWVHKLNFTQLRLNPNQLWRVASVFSSILLCLGPCPLKDVGISSLSSLLLYLMWLPIYLYLFFLLHDLSHSFIFVHFWVYVIPIQTINDHLSLNLSSINTNLLWIILFYI